MVLPNAILCFLNKVLKRKKCIYTIFYIYSHFYYFLCASFFPRTDVTILCRILTVWMTPVVFFKGMPASNKCSQFLFIWECLYFAFYFFFLMELWFDRVFCQHFEYVTPLLSGSHCLGSCVSYRSYYCFPECNEYSLLSCCTQDGFIFVFVLQQCDDVSRCVSFWFCPIGVCGTSWICRFMFLIKFGMFPTIISSNTFSAPFSVFFL